MTWWCQQTWLVCPLSRAECLHIFLASQTLLSLSPLCACRLDLIECRGEIACFFKAIFYSCACRPTTRPQKNVTNPAIININGCPLCGERLRGCVGGSLPTRHAHRRHWLVWRWTGVATALASGRRRVCALASTTKPPSAKLCDGRAECWLLNMGAATTGC